MEKEKEKEKKRGNKERGEVAYHDRFEGLCVVMDFVPICGDKCIKVIPLC